MTYAFLIRQGGYEDELAVEIDAMREHFPVRESLDQVQPGDQLFARFALKPFHELVEQEIIARGASLVVPSAQHAWIEDLGAWYAELADLTARTWMSVEDLDETGYAGPYFVKGRTYSRKHDWDTHAFAPDRAALDVVMANIRRDAAYGAENLVIRQFVPLKTYSHTERGMPITYERRCFVLDGQIVSSGYYWSSFSEDAPDEQLDQRVIDEVLRRCQMRGVRWYVADFALTESGETILIELNDASMTGLSANDPAIMYSRMAALLSDR